MEIKTDREGTTVIARLSGRVEGGTVAQQFQEELQQAINPGDQRVVLDCQELAYISSAGLRAIAIVLNHAQETGVQMDACTMTPPVRKVFEMSGFDQLMGVHETLEEARRAEGRAE